MNFIGNAVLSSGSWQGAVLAGGVSQHLEEYLGADSALEKFKNKGKMTQRMENVPLRLLIDPTAPLIGAASSN
jgi:glucokinase